SQSYNTTISPDGIIPVITKEDVKCLRLKIDWISSEQTEDALHNNVLFSP
ncbi:16085_t:CDS:2, partial [Funneliformis caledonium]